ncbi:UPF0149 family protein [Ferrimonas kyonanensis]|uniref:UPF0149 family protein n=1 Tax=Ferrimonas kyonanensis TaxID=364763 RepID=UPI0004160E12|nr:UPF0149 family protein [Ferrimonas kyonanensis]
MNEKLTKSEEKQLTQVLDEAAQFGGMTLMQSRGYLAHIHCFPRTIDPGVWSAHIANMKPEKELWPFENKTMEMLFTLYNQLHNEVVEKGQVLSPRCQPLLEQVKARTIPQDLRHWCAGFMTGYMVLRENWQEICDSEQLQEVESCSHMMGYLATLGSEEEHALAWRNEQAEPEPQMLLEAIAEAMDYMHGWSQMELDDNNQPVNAMINPDSASH